MKAFALCMAPALGAALALVSASARAGDPPLGPRPESGEIRFSSAWYASTPTITVGLTDAQKQKIATRNWPQDMQVQEDPNPVDVLGNPERPPAPGYKAYMGSITIPQAVGTLAEGVAEVKDISAEVSVGGVKVSQLDVESTARDPTTGAYVLVNIFGTVASDRGLAGLALPLVLADSNGDGVLGGTDDLIFSLVDLSAYLPSEPSFSTGQTFLATAGLVAELPGMFLSTTPIAFDPAFGFFGTPFTGPGFINGHVVIAAIPEPSTWILLIAGLGALGASQRRRIVTRVDCYCQSSNANALGCGVAANQK